MSVAKAQLDTEKKELKIGDEGFNMSDQIDKWMEIANAAQPALLQSILDAGVPLVYLDEQNRRVKQMPDGTIIVLQEAR